MYNFTFTLQLHSLFVGLLHAIALGSQKKIILCMLCMFYKQYISF